VGLLCTMELPFELQVPSTWNLTVHALEPSSSGCKQLHPCTAPLRMAFICTPPPLLALPACPLCLCAPPSLVQNSDLICRYAVLRASALQLPFAAHLYGLPPLALTPASTGNNSSSSSSSSEAPAADPAEGSNSAPAVQQGVKQVVTGGDESVMQLEARLGVTLGIEVRECG
jgi:hypothetical protein